MLRLSMFCLVCSLICGVLGADSSTVLPWPGALLVSVILFIFAVAALLSGTVGVGRTIAVLINTSRTLSHSIRSAGRDVLSLRHRQDFRMIQFTGLLLMVTMVTTADDKPTSPTAKIMEKKLELSQKILAAIVTEDFPGMSTSSDAMLELAKTQWIRNETPEYRAQLKDFWLVLDGLKSAAEDKNADGATLAYVQMTLTCVRCHKYLRTPVK